MKKMKNNKGFTLVELLAVIVVLAIVMGLAVVGITSVLESTRKSAFAADAKSYIDGAHQLVRADEANKLLGSSTSYAPSCSTGTTQTSYIPINAIKLDQGGKSPYGNTYTLCTGENADKASTSVPSCSYVKVSTVVSGTSCNYTYSVYLTDGVYNIVETAEDSVSSDSVRLVSGS